jgi:hypothetical protein
MRQNPGLQITKQEVACLVFPTCIKACHLDVKINGFNLIGIFTLNPGTFSELHFVKSLLTDVKIKHKITKYSRRSTCAECISDSPSTSTFHEVTVLNILSQIPDSSWRRRADRKRKSP